jgi:hypothetical protein
MVLPTTLVRFSGKLVNAFDDAPLHNGLKTVDLSLIHLSLGRVGPENEVVRPRKEDGIRKWRQVICSDGALNHAGSFFRQAR